MQMYSGSVDIRPAMRQSLLKHLVESLLAREERTPWHMVQRKEQTVVVALMDQQNERTGRLQEVLT